jgi:hypothetical protein
MAIQKPANKIILNIDGTKHTLIDLSTDTELIPEKVFHGISFHKANGAPDTGTLLETATTAKEGHVLVGYTFYDSNGVLKTGTMPEITANGEGFYKVTENADGTYEYEFIADDISTATVDLFAGGDTKNVEVADGDSITIIYVNDAGQVISEDFSLGALQIDGVILKIRKNTAVTIISSYTVDGVSDSSVDSGTGDNGFKEVMSLEANSVYSFKAVSDSCYIHLSNY